jgi:uncharacterized ubiquitin-like protein YukD
VSTCSSKEKEAEMSDVPVTVVLPSGGTRSAEVPNDVAVKDLIPELTTSLQLPVTGPDGRPMSYRIDSKALGRELQEEETLAQAKVPEGDRLIMTADVTAGGR